MSYFLLYYLINDKKYHNRIKKTAQRIIGRQYESYDSLYFIRVLNKAKEIINDSSHPLYNKYNFLPSSKRLKVLNVRPNAIQNHLYLAQLICLICNSNFYIFIHTMNLYIFTYLHNVYSNTYTMLLAPCYLHMFFMFVAKQISVLVWA